MNRSLNLEFIFQKLYNLITGASNLDGAKSVVSVIDTILTVIFAIAGVFFLVVIIYVLIKKSELKKKEEEANNKPHSAEIQTYKKNERWQSVLDHVDSINPSDWRLAIIEADNILDEMVTKIGYKGENLGEKLKSVEPSDFLTLQSAWEAHKVRNKIAHEGLSYKLDQREAKRVISMFEEVFQEFQYI